MYLKIRFSIFCLAALLSACPDLKEAPDGGAVEVQDGGINADTAFDDAGISPLEDAGIFIDAGCVKNEFNAVISRYLTTSQGDFALFFDHAEGVTRKIQLELYLGERTPTSLEIPDENFSECTVCLSLLEDCASQDGECNRHFLAHSGTIALTAYDDQNLAGTISGAEASEITIDPDTAVSTPVVNGDGWCLAPFDFSVTVVN